MSTPGFRDHFSHGADDYARYRPAYPAALFDWIAWVAPRRYLALDVATGNGQAAVPLAQRFSRVVAVDASTEQLLYSVQRPNIDYHRALAHATGLAGGSADVVTVAQALHWLDRPAFFEEARRVLRSHGVLVAWCYRLMHVDPAVDRVVDAFYHDKVGSYWPPERKLVEDGYAGIDFPFNTLPVPAFSMRHEWTLEQVVGYIATWSPTRGYREQTGKDPIPELHEELRGAWGDPARKRPVEWPLGIRAGTPEM